ncbi:hypothetical protein [Actinomadura rudentiformis]|uniref:Uncharacterized protein n=1 Tax=Actinomadura rudentiformis TaxID=359158 RepID=A0A6H9YRF1_9ACTN|nr:hypothetical protein [Actinomadura rudentiformis]KAB2345636.1 hypothetical protein F8566_27245 [Actinomadura rudentiformis]
MRQGTGPKKRWSTRDFKAGSKQVRALVRCWSGNKGFTQILLTHLKRTRGKKWVYGNSTPIPCKGHWFHVVYYAKANPKEKYYLKFFLSRSRSAEVLVQRWA